MNFLKQNKKTAYIITAVCVLLVAALIISQAVRPKSIEPLSSENYYLDTTCTLFVYEYNGSTVNKLSSEDKNAVQKIFDGSWDICRGLDKKLSKTVEVSDVSRINNAGGQWVEVDSDTLNIITAGIMYGDLSNGDFDITIGTVTDLWDYHADNPKVPEQSVIDEAVSHVGYRQIQIDGNKVRLQDPAAKLDLGGIAKGYVADRIAEYMKAQGVTSGIVNLGGNIVTIGTKPDSEGFKIGIEKPYSGRSENIGYVYSSNQTIVSSGVYERQFKVDDKIYHHILSPKTGYPVETDLDAVSLIGDFGHSMDADALSTICLIKGSKEGKEFITGQGMEAVFCLTKGDIVQTNGFKLQTN
ncbi:MAG: FAD:protein FMN transferase [Mogibacterium sp.]|nr:FAD:protein FMN transferase [Mogibacterium sp.]